MNYFLMIVILAVCGGAYYMHTQDQQQIDLLQSQLAAAAAAAAAAEKKAAAAPTPSVTDTAAAPGTGPALSADRLNAAQAAKTHDLDNAAPVLSGGSSAPAAPLPPVQVIQPNTHSGAIDAAAQAAAAAANSASIGTVTTLDNHTYTNCKVLKVEQDGVTFSHDEGITKILYPMMSPALQQKFGYTPQQAVAETEAQIRAEQQQTAVTNAPASP